MLKRPSSRRKSSTEGITLNLVPIIDTMVTLIAFMLFTMAVLDIVHIETPFPITSSHENEEKLKEKPLQLTVSIRENDTEIWSPFNRIASKTIPNLSPGLPDIKSMHDALVVVKQQYPFESKIVVVPFPGATYDTLIAAMDAMRMVDAGDPPIYRENPATRNNELVKMLFPDVVFGNLLGDT